ncbi:MAG TPA: redox-sensing transcriptional repressor Rex [Treponemataceae bacterium]|nr:redox-sensing transcriptional repressor Rex [Treponemataceae bacterium]
MKKIPEPTRKRLIRLAQLLLQLIQNGDIIITSLQIQELTGWSNTTIRKDISYINVKCGASNGYKIEELHKAISRKFDLHINAAKKKCCIVGLGKIGEALLEYTGFKNSRFELVAGFDPNANRTEILNAPFPLYTTMRLEQIIKELDIEYAILSTSDKDAPAIAEKLAQWNIKGIVNYTNAVISVPSTITVKDVGIISALQTLW